MHKQSFIRSTVFTTIKLRSTMFFVDVEHALQQLNAPGITGALKQVEQDTQKHQHEQQEIPALIIESDSDDDVIFVTEVQAEGKRRA